MIFHRCDRCGKETKKPFIVKYPEFEGIDVIGYEEHEIYGERNIELCAECIKDFKKWLEEREQETEEKENRENRAFTEQKGKIIAVDFDGFLCEGKYPEIGAPRYDALLKVMREQGAGAKIILWTCREGKRLQEAVRWCKGYGLIFDAVNENLPEQVAKWGTDPRKIGADEYWDDRATNADKQ